MWAANIHLPFPGGIPTCGPKINPITYRKQVSEAVTAVAEELKKYDDSRKFKYDELKGNQCLTGVDATRKEVNHWVLNSIIQLWCRLS